MRTTRELPGAFVADIVEFDALERGVHGGGERGAGEALEAREEEEVLARGQRLLGEVMLRTHPLHSTQHVFAIH